MYFSCMQYGLPLHEVKYGLPSGLKLGSLHGPRFLHDSLPQPPRVKGSK